MFVQRNHQEVKKFHKQKNLMSDFPFGIYPLISEIPRRIKRTPIMNTSQKIPPLRKTHAAFNILRSFSNKVQEYAEDIQASKIIPTTKIKPENNSVLLFMFYSGNFYLKSLLYFNKCFHI